MRVPGLTVLAGAALGAGTGLVRGRRAGHGNGCWGGGGDDVGGDGTVGAGNFRCWSCGSGGGEWDVGERGALGGVVVGTTIAF